MAGMQITLLRVRRLLVLLFVFGLVAAPGARQAVPPQAAQAQPPALGAVAGVRNFTKVDSTIACGGALSPEAFEALMQAGYKSVVNLRGASEPGNNVEEARKAAEAAGLKYFHLPFVAASPDLTMLDEFLKIAVKPENQPMMLHCASGGRASMFWAVKRVMIDGWPIDKAMSELPDLSKNVSQPSRALFLDYLKAHGKTRP
jgi:uncharacterized protein (TIGR01244 family)